MKRRIGISLLLAAALLLASGCNREYFERIDELQARLDALQASCDKINRQLTELQSLISALEEKDMITGTTEIKEDGVVTGVKINFANHASVTITNGKDGKTPLISSKHDSDGNYYWTVQYGDGNVEWVLDSSGNKILATGVLPYLAIRNGMWCYSLDGKNYVEIGPADGKPGDQLFAGFDTSNPDYVIITLSNGEKLKIPTYAAYLSLKEKIETVNKNTNAQAEIIRATLDKITYLTSVAPILSGKDTIGTTIILSNGKKGEIYDWTSPVTPVIFAKKDTDGNLYWAYEFGNLGEQWVLDPSGKKIPASSDPAEAPLVGVAQGDDGEWYWTVTYKGTTELLRFPVSGGYAPHAQDSAVNCAFSAVVETQYTLEVVLKDGTKLSLPKQFTVAFSYEDGKTFVGDTLTMKMVSGGDRKRLQYQVFGPSPKISTICEGGFEAKAVEVNGKPCIEFHAPALFQNGVGKVLVIFTFGNNAAAVSVVRSFYFKREE